ncbi:hypothetical protein AWC38_SpisGene16507, partial [Stylophora pistillata]
KKAIKNWVSSRLSVQAEGLGSAESGSSQETHYTYVDNTETKRREAEEIEARRLENERKQRENEERLRIAEEKAEEQRRRREQLKEQRQKEVEEEEARRQAEEQKRLELEAELCRRRDQLFNYNQVLLAGHDTILAAKGKCGFVGLININIINCSFAEARLLQSWKHADIVPILKRVPVYDANRHLRHVSLTPVLSKVAEEFVVEQYVKPAVLAKVDPGQFGTIPGSSTTEALMTHAWNSATDGNGATVRAVLFNFKKAVDLNDHGILIQKLRLFDIHEAVISWFTDFLCCRKQRVKLGQECFSEWRDAPAGVSQGTKLGPWLFIIMKNDLDIPGFDLWKYVDDSTISEIIPHGQASNIQTALASRGASDKFQLNETKCKEIRISLSTKETLDLDPIVTNHKHIDIVSQAKMVCVNVLSDLKWNHHIAEVVKKARKRLFCLSQLKRSGLGSDELVQFYRSCIRPITEYTCRVFHDSLPVYLSQPMMQQEINDIGKFSTTSAKFGTSANKLPVGQKYHLIKSHFVPPINYKFPTRFLHQCRRGFQSRYLSEYSWMVYSPSVDGVFCKHCDLMIPMHCRKDKGAFVNKPFINWQKPQEKEKRHEQMKYHHDAMIAAESFLNWDESPELNMNNRIDDEKRKNIIRNRHIFKCVSEAILKECDDELFPNIYALLKMCATIPATSCECERSASSLTRLHTYSRECMCRERLSSLALMFATKHPRRLELGTILRD